MRRRALVAALAATTLVLAACGDDDATTDNDAADTTAASETTEAGAAGGTGNDCTTGNTLAEGKLTVATGDPAFSPWVENFDPASGEGFESALAYAIADELGFGADNVVWTSTTFDEAIQPGAKEFDFNLQQYSITEERAETISFSDPYYTTNQAIVALAGSPAEGATSIADLQDVRFGAQAGTTSLDFITEVIQPSTEPLLYDDNVGAKAALEADQIDAIVVDLPTAFYIAAVEIEGASVIGQFPADAGGTGDDFGLVFEKDNPLVDCVNDALGALKESGELEQLEQQWLSDATNAPVISVD